MLLKYGLTVALLLHPFLANTQMTSDSRIYGENDRDLVTPSHSPNTTSDPSAIEMFITFMRTSGLTGWKGMTANGNINLAGDPASHPAKLLLLGGKQSRLDVTLDAGTQSTILNGTRGVFVDASGKRSFLSSDMAEIGLLAFPRFLSAGYPTNATITTDRGITSVGGSALRRITLDDPGANRTGWETTDLYFDPKSGELIESVAPVHLSTSDASLYMLETRYTNYQAFGGGKTKAPFTISQFLNGQLQWTLTLSDASTAVLPAISDFKF